MKKPKRLASVVCAFALSICMGELRAQEISSNELSADIVRVLSRDLFDINSIPYLQPMVEAFNATSNAGFYHTAHVPAQDTFYVRVGVRGMSVFVRDDQRLCQPLSPSRARLQPLLRAVLDVRAGDGDCRPGRHD